MKAQVVQLFPENIKAARERMRQEREAQRTHYGHVLQDVHDMLPERCTKVYRVCGYYMDFGLDGCHNCPNFGGPDNAA